MGLFEFLFGKDKKEVKPVIKQEPKTDIIGYFTVKDKYQLSSNGTDNFYFVDDKLATYYLERKYSNIYTWRSSKIGDRIKTTRIFYPHPNDGCDGCDGYYDNYLKYDIAEVLNDKV